MKKFVYLTIVVLMLFGATNVRADGSPPTFFVSGNHGNIEVRAEAQGESLLFDYVTFCYGPLPGKVELSPNDCQFVDIVWEQTNEFTWETSIFLPNGASFINFPGVGNYWLDSFYWKEIGFLGDAWVIEKQYVALLPLVIK